MHPNKTHNHPDYPSRSHKLQSQTLGKTNMRFLAILVLCLPSLATAKKTTKPCVGQACYTCEQNKRIKARIAQLTGCKQKVINRDKAIAKIKKTITSWQKKDTKKSKLLHKLRRQRDQAFEQKVKAKEEVRRAWITFWSVTGVLVVGAAVAIVGIVITRPAANHNPHRS